MSEHQWAEHRFDPFNQERRCAMQTWKCKKCELTIDLPESANPNDYIHPPCKKKEQETVVKKKWFSPNKQDYPAKRRKS